MRHPYEFSNHYHQITCPICGRTLSTSSRRQVYCNSPECQLVRYEHKKSKQMLRRERNRQRKEKEYGLI